MERLLAAILIPLLALRLHVAASRGQGSSYKAGVFQHVDPSDPRRSLDDVMRESVATYQRWTMMAASMGVHILVFPEYGVTGLSVPSDRLEIRPYLQVLPWLEPGLDPWNPCLESDDSAFNATILKSLSCIARDNNLIVVVNLPTLVSCSTVDNESCPSDGGYQFNTNVVLNVDGTVLATYHKINLYLEPAFDRPPYPSDHVTIFETNFATFGLLTCFDLLWHNPTVTLVQEKGVGHLIMPTAWIDGLPFLTSVQSQMAWAIGLDIVLLAANIQKSSDGYRGSGIYHGRQGFLTYDYGPTNVSRLIVADIPLSVDQHMATPVSVFNYSGIIYDDPSNYTFIALYSSLENFRMGCATLIYGNLTCSIEYEFQEPVNDGDYFLAGYEGSITLGDGTYRLAIQTCALMWCEDADVTRCVHPPVTSNSHLIALKLRGRFDTPYIYPSILQHDLLLIDTSEWTFEANTTDLQVTEALLATQPGFSYRPIVASLYGRLYDMDG